MRRDPAADRRRPGSAAGSRKAHGPQLHGEVRNRGNQIGSRERDLRRVPEHHLSNGPLKRTGRRSAMGKLPALALGGLLVLLAGVVSSPAAARDTAKYVCSLTGKT